MALEYQWRRIVSGTPTPISGATASTYELVEDDEGKDIDCAVSNGGVTAYAVAVGPVAPAEPGVLRRYPTLIDPPESQYPEIVQDQPEYLEPVQFGDLETVVVRITDSNNQAHTYATQQAFNSDQTMVMLYHSGNGAMVLDTATWSVLRSGITGSGGSAGVHQFWDPINPSILWRHASSGDQLSAYDFSTDTSQTWSVSAESGSPYTAVRIGEGEGTISADGRYIALVCRRGDGNVYVAVWDTVLDAVDGTLTLEDWSVGGSGLDNAHVSPSGDYVVLASKRAGNLGHLIYDRETLTFQRAYTGGVGTNSNDGFPGHMDIGYRTNGDECLVRLRKDGGLVTVRLSDGDERLEVPAAHMSWGVHVSCRNRLRPGYAYVSMYYVDYDYAKYLRHEVFAVRLDGSGHIERFGQAMFPDNGSYDLQTKATVSPYGDIVLMTSGWGTTTPREYVMYVPETMP